MDKLTDGQRDSHSEGNLTTDLEHWQLQLLLRIQIQCRGKSHTEKRTGTQQGRVWTHLHQEDLAATVKTGCAHLAGRCHQLAAEPICLASSLRHLHTTQRQAMTSRIASCCDVIASEPCLGQVISLQLHRDMQTRFKNVKSCGIWVKQLQLNLTCQ